MFGVEPTQRDRQPFAFGRTEQLVEAPTDQLAGRLPVGRRPGLVAVDDDVVIRAEPGDSLGERIEHLAEEGGGGIAGCGHGDR